MELIDIYNLSDENNADYIKLTRYRIATDRANKTSILVIIFPEEILNNLKKMLNKLKKDKQISFYISKEDFNKETQEVQYLLNKIPSLIDSLPKKQNYYVISI